MSNLPIDVVVPRLADERWEAGHAARLQRMPQHRIVDRLALDADAEREALIGGLVDQPAHIPPKYFYDDLGCALFGAICALPEYYPCRTEVAIFRASRLEIAGAIGTGKQFVDLGAGDCRKGASWIPYLQPRRYIAVDIALFAIDKALAGLATRFPETAMVGVALDFAAALDLRDTLDGGPVTFFYPGSSIGNFAPDEALRLLRQIRDHCAAPGSGLLIGVDAKKDPQRLEAAYDDAVGVTAAFNRNVLAHVNRRIGSDFHPERFAHRALYDADAGRVEMHLEAIEPQAVHIDGTERRFAAGERIHTENSYKYAPSEFGALLRDAGFADIRLWQDHDRQFSVFYAE
jgi:dimethylhistidine N-methyltransferase